MAKELTQQEINEIVENTMAKLGKDGITDEDTVKSVIMDEISKARKSSQDKMRFRIEDMVKELSSSDESKTNTQSVPTTTILNESKDDITVNSINTDTPPTIISEEENIQKISAKQTAADVAKKYMDEKKSEHEHNYRSDRQDVKEAWSVRADRKKDKHKDDGKKLKEWQKKLVVLMNKPMKIMDFIVRILGSAFEPIFCIAIPILVMIFPINQLAVAFVNSMGYFVTWAFYPVFLFFLLFLPKVASAIEFFVLGVYFICKSGLLRFISASLADWIDPLGFVTYAPGVNKTNLNNYILTLGWLTVYGALVFIIFKLIFFAYLKLKVYRRRYMVRHRHRKKYVATLDNNSEVLM